MHYNVITPHDWTEYDLCTSLKVEKTPATLIKKIDLQLEAVGLSHADMKSVTSYCVGFYPSS